eukprot:3526488-Prymnesium_polylepis.1
MGGVIEAALEQRRHRRVVDLRARRRRRRAIGLAERRVARRLQSHPARRVEKLARERVVLREALRQAGGVVEGAVERRERVQVTHRDEAAIA